MYSFLYILYVIVSSVLTLWFFWWALRSGQFKDQRRARFLPLVERGRQGGAARATGSGFPVMGVLGLVVATLFAAAVVIVYALVQPD